MVCTEDGSAGVVWVFQESWNTFHSLDTAGAQHWHAQHYPCVASLDLYCLHFSDTLRRTTCPPCSWPCYPQPKPQTPLWTTRDLSFQQSACCTCCGLPMIWKLGFVFHYHWQHLYFLKAMLNSTQLQLHFFSTTCISMFYLVWYRVFVLKVNSQKTPTLHIVEAAEMMNLDLIHLAREANVEIPPIIHNIISTPDTVGLLHSLYWPQFQWSVTGFTLVKWRVWEAVNVCSIVFITLFDCVLSRGADRGLILTVVTSGNKTSEFIEKLTLLSILIRSKTQVNKPEWNGKDGEWEAST